MSIEPGDLFMKYDGTLWLTLFIRGNGSWSIYCPSTNKMSWEWGNMLLDNGGWGKLA